MRSRTLWPWLGVAVLLLACEALGNPPQQITPPAVWSRGRASITTTTQSFSNAKTIKRLVREGLGDLTYADDAVGPGQTLTLVTAVPSWRQRRRQTPARLVTVFEMANGRKVERRWSGPPHDREWRAAFALPDAPRTAITVLAP